MKKRKGFGEGLLLGGILAAAVIAVMVFTAVQKASYTEIIPVHSLDIIVTPRPKININTADIEEISSIKGIGEVIAQRIVDRREENGLYRSIDELLEVSGIGEAKLEDIREEICIN